MQKVKCELCDCIIFQVSCYLYDIIETKTDAVCWACYAGALNKVAIYEDL